MFLKIAFRNLLKRKVFAIINITGLAIGMAACILIYLHVSFEQSFDKSYPDSESLYRIAREHGSENEKQSTALVNYALGDFVANDLSSVKMLTRLSHELEVKVKHDKNLYTESNVFFADKNLFEVFGIQSTEGDLSRFSDPFTAVLNVEVANKLFPDQSAINQIVNINDRDYEVVAVVNDLPVNSHFHFDYLLSLASSKEIYGPQMFEHWGNVWIYTYVKLADGVNPKNFQADVNQLVKEKGPEVLSSFGVSFFVQPVEDIHLYSNLNGEIEANSDYKVLNVLMAVGILVLLIACFNFINLTTARATWRAKEVGVKKVLGASRVTLISQFLRESLLISTLALFIGFVLMAAALPAINAFSTATFQRSDLWVILPFSLFIALVVGIVAGLFPAFFLSSLSPNRMLTGKSSQGDSRLAVIMRKVLIVFQFTTSIVLIIASLSIFQQLKFIKNKDLGLNVHDVMVVELKSGNTIEQKETFINKVKQYPFVERVSASSDLPFENLNSWRVKPRGIEVEEQLIDVVTIDDEYLNTLSMTLSQGGEGTRKLGSEHNILVNEAFTRHYLLPNPLGTEIEISHREQPVQIVGVVKDYHFESLHNTIRPLMLVKLDNWHRNVSLKIVDDYQGNVTEQVKSAWSEINPDEPFEFYFLEDRFNELYQSEEKMASLVGYFSGLSILIACLGLYGLAAFVAESKTKEISVRKVLGADLKNLMKIQFDIFTTLLVISAIIAIPLGYYLMDSWLQNFAFRTDISWWILVVAVVTVMFFMVLSVGYRSLKAARVNPIDSLRNE